MTYAGGMSDAEMTPEPVAEFDGYRIDREFAEDAGRYVVTRDGEEVGYTAYLRDTVREVSLFMSTFIVPEHRVPGLANLLVDTAVRERVAAGDGIEAPCSFVAARLDRVPELLAPRRP